MPNLSHLLSWAAFSPELSMITIRSQRSSLRRLVARLSTENLRILCLIGFLLAGTSGLLAQEPPPDSPLARADAPEGMVWIPGGTFQMGSTEVSGPPLNVRPDELPAHEVRVNPFWMDRHEVTNAQFAAFVKATGYVTVAERPLDPKDFPGVPTSELIPGALNFQKTSGPVSTSDWMQWWIYQKGASWKHPEGPQSNLEGRWDHPVVCVAWEDAMAYAKWAGKRLPTEAEWEFAARGGKKDAVYPWGTESSALEKRANTWQGSFPDHNSLLDGFEAIAPVKSFPPNPYGLYDMAGNVWEYCLDWYDPDYYRTSRKDNPAGPAHPPKNRAPEKVIRGGSWLCNPGYCSGFRVAARMRTTPDTGSNHVGFRCVRSAPARPADDRISQENP